MEKWAGEGSLAGKGALTFQVDVVNSGLTLRSDRCTSLSMSRDPAAIQRKTVNGMRCERCPTCANDRKEGRHLCMEARPSVACGSAPLRGAERCGWIIDVMRCSSTRQIPFAQPGSSEKKQFMLRRLNLWMRLYDWCPRSMGWGIFV